MPKTPFDRLFKMLKSERFWVAAIPYVWISLFFALPFVIILRVSLSEDVLAVPPYSDLLHLGHDFTLTLTLKAKSYFYILHDAIYLSAYLQSLHTAAVTTFWTLLLGFPMAYGIANLKRPYHTIALLLVVLPFWTSFLLRIYAWLNLLTPYGLINKGLLALGFIQEPLPLLFNNTAVIIGMVYCYVPFMIVPCYVILEKMDRQLLEAAADLGARPLNIFFSMTLPLALPGILTGCLLVFIPCVGEFVIPEILGGADSIFIGRMLWNEFFLNRSWPTAAALACTLLVMLFLPIYGLQFLQSKYAKKNI